MGVQSILNQIIRAGFAPTDTQELKLKKLALTLVPLMIAPAAVIWGAVYIWIDRPLAGAFPLIYALLSTLILAYSFKTKRVLLLQYSQLLLLLFLPFLMMWSLGGFANGSIVMIWAIFPPIASVIFYSKRQALYWFFAYFALIIVSVIMDHTLSELVEPLPDTTTTIFFLLNIGCASAGLFLLISYAVNEEKNAIIRLRKERELLKTAQVELLSEKQKAETANFTKTTFLANMSHELRTPLNAIIGFSESMKSEIMGPMENERYLGYSTDIYSSGKHLLQIINDILDVSAAEVGKLDLQKAEVDVETVVGQCINLVRGRAHDNNISIHAEIDTSGPTVVADELRLKQVLVNLLNNAVKFTNDGGSVTITGHPANANHYTLQITDTGIGMTEQGITKALIPFERPDEHGSNPEGTGLGLPLSKTLVDLHGGELEIVSEVGKGTTVSVILPV